MIRREVQAVLELDAHHRAFRRCHGCGSYARPSAEREGRVLCEKCLEKARRETDEPEDLNRVIEA